MCVHPKFANWNLYEPGFRVATKKRKPAVVLERHRAAGQGQDGLTEHVQDEADEPMVCGQRQDSLAHEDNVLEVVDDAFAVEEVHGRRQPVPAEALCGPNVARPARDTGNSDDLLKRHDLDRSYNGDDVDMAHEQSSEETADHHKCPECPGYEVGLLLLVVGLGGLLGHGLLQRPQVSNAPGVRLGKYGQTHFLNAIERDAGPRACGRAGLLARLAETCAPSISRLLVVGELDPAALPARHGARCGLGGVMTRRGHGGSEGFAPVVLQRRPRLPVGPDRVGGAVLWAGSSVSL